MDKREKLIESAIKLFAENGINGTSTGSIAKDAGVAAGTLFNYFPSKEDLIRSAYVECKKDMACNMQDEGVTGANFRELFRSTYEQGLMWALENPERNDFIQQFLRQPDLYDETLEEQLQGEMNFFKEGLVAAQGGGEIIDVDIRYLQVLFTSWFDGSVRYIRTLEESRRAEFIEASFEMLWGAITVGKPIAGVK